MPFLFFNGRGEFMPRFERDGREGDAHRRPRPNRDDVDADNPKNRRRDVHDEIGDELQFAYRQSATRCVERARHNAMLPSDRLFAIFALYFANRDDKFVQRILASTVRLEYSSPTGLLTSTQYTKDEVTDLQKVLADLERAAVAATGDVNARATCDAHESFWAKCHRLLSALEAARDAEEAARLRLGNISSAAKDALEEVEDSVLALLNQYDNLPMAVVELKALARCEVPGVDSAFFAAAAVMAEVVLSKRLLDQYEEQYFVDAPLPPPPVQRSADPDAVLTEAECAVLMDNDGETLEGDQQLFMDELPTYGREHPPAWTKAVTAGPAAIQPKKPDRFAKVISGFKWSKYNRAHYDSVTNPPPRTVTAYEFTLYYPELMGRRMPEFEVLPTDKGWDDEYCLLVFRAGPPYLDVAYRIVNKQWDKGRGVKVSFEPNGKFRLYFRFTSTSYKC